MQYFPVLSIPNTDMDFNAYFRDRSLLKTPREGVHFEQKTTPDLIWCVALVISELVATDANRIFSDRDIRESETFNSLMQDYFSKAPQAEAENEYNKVSSYQLGVLAYASVLAVIPGKPRRYQVVNMDIINHISVNDLNAARFLGEYTDKFLADNGLLPIFEQYKNNQNQANHLLVKEAYWNWAVANTAIKGTDRKHTYRVFNKIFNIYCYKHRIRGEDASNITAGPCPYSFLIYNRDNFRDKDKPSGMTRQQYQDEVLSDIDNEGVVATLLKKAKDAVRVRHGNDSEIKDPTLGYEANSGVHVHHILPQHSYSQYSLSRENLIALTPGQHFSRAHIEGNTRTINPEFQVVCLKQKFSHIKESIEVADDFYSLQEFIKILNTCFNTNLDENLSVTDVETFLATI